MNRIRFTQKVLVLVFLTILSVPAHAIYNPTHTYSAKVQVTFSNSSPTGSGLVYATQNTSAPVDESDIDWSDNGYEGGNSSETENEELPVYLYAKANKGYKFNGWAESPTGTPVNPVSPFLYKAIVGNNDYGPYYSHPYRQKTYTVYADFSLIDYTITYVPEGGTVSGGNTQTYTITDTKTLHTVIKTGYTFNGWKVTAVDETDSGWNLNGNAPSKLNKHIGNVTLTAQWTPTDYTISFSANGGTGTGPSSIGYTIESSGKTLPACPYTRTGYLFTGWKPTSNAGNWTTSESYASGATVPTGKYGTVTLAAQWKEPSDIIISVRELSDGENAIFNVSKNGSVIFTVAVSAASPSVTIKNQVVGEYTVTPTSWSWAYSMSPSSITKTISSSDHTFSFTATKDTNARNSIISKHQFTRC